MKERTEKNRNGRIMLVLALAVLVMPLAAADSYELLCLYDGDSINFGVTCAPGRPIVTAPQNGVRQQCVHNLDDGKICSAPPNTCNSLGLSCSATGGGEVELDITPPVITVTAPAEGSIFTDKSVFLNFEVNEPASVYYQDNSKPGKWTKVCTNCASYSNHKNFKEGLNDLTFKAVDMADNEGFFEVSFYIDSKVPKIKSTAPTKGFSSGEFIVEFTEDNPVSVVLYYGVFSDMREQIVNIEECATNSGYDCAVQANLADFDGQKIDYYFAVTDIAGNLANSKTIQLDVDYSFPEITDFTYNINGKYATFKLEVTEPYLKEIVYIDLSEPKPKEKKLCSVLSNGVCEKKVSFKDGEHDVKIIVRDLAGNEAFVEVPGEELFTDSKAPKVSSVEPKKGFASGMFEVKFKEENPLSVVLNYGNNAEMKSTEVELSSCTLGREYSCLVEVELDEFDGQNFEYSFVVTDRAGQTGSKGASGLKVDITSPVINSINYALAGKKATFTLDITELNLDEVTYINLDDPRPREKKLCSKLSNGICEKKITLNSGTNRLTFVVYDKAGNSAGQGVEIAI